MRRKWTLRILVVTLICSLFSIVPAQSATLSPELQQTLDSSKYVYIQTERRDGSFSKAAEIWFMPYQDAVWVVSPATTHRVKRIQAGKTKAKVWIGKSDGPSFDAQGSIVKDPEINKVVLDTFAKKYADSWSSYEKSFRDGLADGSRVLIKYAPAE